MSEVIIRDFDNRYAADFKQLNLDWIEEYFEVEGHDLEQLDNPGDIISGGGYILLGFYNGKVEAVCALIKTGDCEFELAKMAVNKHLRGQQLGKKLGVAVIEKARSAGATRVWLDSNRKLIPAIRLYQSLGFKEIPAGETPYARSDIRMELFF